MVTVKAKVFVIAEARIEQSTRRLLGEGSGYQLVGHADSVNELPATLSELQPHVILMQHTQQNLKAVKAIRDAKEVASQVKLLVLLLDEADFWSALESYAEGYVLWPTAWLPTALDVVVHGGIWLGPLIAEYLLRGPGYSIMSSVARTLTSMPASFQLLSAREREVLVLLLDGLTNQQIANALKLSVGTVKVHVRHILKKLDVDHRGEAIVKLTKLSAASLSPSS